MINAPEIIKHIKTEETGVYSDNHTKISFDSGSNLYNGLYPYDIEYKAKIEFYYNFLVSTDASDSEKKIKEKQAKKQVLEMIYGDIRHFIEKVIPLIDSGRVREAISVLKEMENHFLNPNFDYTSVQASRG